MRSIFLLILFFSVKAMALDAVVPGLVQGQTHLLFDLFDLLGFEEGDIVRITSGPFADFNGTINEINADQAKLKVLVNIFDRETPVELSFDQVARV
jgi:ribosomal protein S4E